MLDEEAFGALVGAADERARLVVDGGGQPFAVRPPARLARSVALRKRHQAHRLVHAVGARLRVRDLRHLPPPPPPTPNKKRRKQVRFSLFFAVLDSAIARTEVVSDF